MGQATLSNYEKGSRDTPAVLLVSVAGALELSIGEVLDVDHILIVRDPRMREAVRILVRSPDVLDSIVGPRPPPPPRPRRAQAREQDADDGESADAESAAPADEASDAADESADGDPQQAADDGESADAESAAPAGEASGYEDESAEGDPQQDPGDGGSADAESAAADSEASGAGDESTAGEPAQYGRDCRRRGRARGRRGARPPTRRTGAPTLTIREVWPSRTLVLKRRFGR